MVAVGLWSYFGLGVVIYLAGMANVPRDYFDAARIDGANWFQQIVTIAIPLLLPTIGYWSVFGQDDPEGQFRVSQSMRRVWAAVQPIHAEPGAAADRGRM